MHTTPRIAFLHTADVHVPRFNALVHAQAPAAIVHHHVDAALLHDARTHGINHPDLIARVQQAMHTTAQHGASVVVCTCSTIGGIAESMDSGSAFTAMRIDRAMANAAARSGPAVLLVAALESTLAPTADLLHDSARQQSSTLQIDTLCVPQAWAFFEQGDTCAYLDTIASATRHAVSGHGAVVLAQASMDAVAPRLATLGLPVLASPALGVAAALAAATSAR